MNAFQSSTDVRTLDGSAHGGGPTAPTTAEFELRVRYRSVGATYIHWVAEE